MSDNNEDLFQDKTKKIKIKTKKIKPKKDVEFEKIDFPSLEGKFLVIKVGSPEEPADDKAIAAIEDEIVNLITRNDVNCLVYVTSHKINIQVFG